MMDDPSVRAVAMRVLGRAVSSTRLGASAVSGISRSGLIRPVRPDRLLRIAAAPLRLGGGLATLGAIAAARDPEHPAIIDERGTVSYGELDRRSAAIAAGLRSELGAGPDRAVAVLCRNHRGFVEAALAASRCGADLLSTGTALPAPQLRELLGRERPAAIVHDEEFALALDEAGFTDNRVVAWHDQSDAHMTLDELASLHRGEAASCFRQGKLILLTSGTTGTPKRAPRKPSGHAVLGPAATVFSRVPFRAREPMLIAPPLFHGFGFAFLALGLALGSTIAVRRKFSPEAVLASIERDRISTLVAVPVMLQRIVELPVDTRARYETGSLRLAVSAAAPLEADLATRFMDAFGDVLYDVYGTTEVGLGTLATPADLRAAPGTVGKPMSGTTVKVLGDDHAEVPRGKTGHVFVGGGFAFEGYSDSGTRETLDGMINTGDLGHLDGEGRLFIDGREDDMIVSGGENVFPLEVEAVLRRHPAVADVAVVGVDDPEFGQRLAAYVVRRANRKASETELKKHVTANVERFKAPREILFIDELPRNPMGKVLRRKLPAVGEAPAVRPAAEAPRSGSRG
jgi:acyl-CoA synthetase (AMP-forming)/AMP-acid ligase II